MKILNKLLDFLFDIAGKLLIIVSILILAFIIKWKMDSLYFVSTSPDLKKFTIIDEIKKTRLQVNNLFNGKNKEELKQAISNEEKENKSSVKIIIKKNAGINDIATELISKNLISDVSAFKKLVYDMGLESEFIEGSYKIPLNNKIKDTILTLTNKKLKSFNFVVNQGDDVNMVAFNLKKEGIIKSQHAFVEEYNNKAAGKSFIPGTYTFETPIRVIKIIELLTTKN